MNKNILCTILITSVSLSAYCQSVLETIIPKPVSIEATTGKFIFDSSTEIVADIESKASIKFLKTFLANKMDFRGSKLATKKKVKTKLIITKKGSEDLGKEAYKLTITPNQITINAKDAGVFYAIQTLIQLFPNQRNTTVALPCVKIIDQPRFAYRGLMLDVSRHFFSVAEVKALLDLMAAYKLNRFHWHLTDDQGWRIEIKSYPKLTQIGAWRVPRKDFGMEPPGANEAAADGGFYTQGEIKEVVRYAAERHIEIMPEIDVPGHSMAAIAAYPELSVTQNKDTKVNPGSSFAKWFPTGGFEMYVDNALNPIDENVYTFLDKVFGEVASLFPYDYIHIGGDECFKGFWEKDPALLDFMKKNNIKDMHSLQSYFTARVTEIVRSKNKKAIGWDEIFDKDNEQQVAIMNRYGEKGAVAQAKKKLDLIMAPGINGLYFDYAQSYSEMEPSSHGQFSPLWKAYQYNPDYNTMNAEDKKRIMGIEACIWTETIPSVAKLEYMLLPRMLALSEIAWSKIEHKNYPGFKTTALPIHLERFDQKGMNYRVPAVFESTDTLMVGQEFDIELKAPVPDSKVFYTLNNRFPSDADHLYTSPIQLKLEEDKKYILKTIVVTPAGKRSVVTRTIFYNPTLRKSVAIQNSKPDLTYKFIDLDKMYADSGILNVNNLEQFKKRNNYLLKVQGYVYIPEDGHYEFSSNQQSLSLSIAGSTVIDTDKPYPRFDKPDPVYLQKGYHHLELSTSRLSEAVLKIYSNELNKKPIEVVN